MKKVEYLLTPFGGLQHREKMGEILASLAAASTCEHIIARFEVTALKA
jgi:hypothetical protein